MKHFVTIVQEDSICACYAFDSRKDAIARFHSELAYAMNANITTMVIVANSNASVVASEKYIAPRPEPETEEPQDGDTE